MSRNKRIAVFLGAFALLIVMGVVGALAGQRAAEERQQSQELLATAAESLDDCPWGEASCVLALGIERALRFGNVEAVTELAEPDFYDCPGRPQQSPDEPFPLCEGSPEFTRREGYPVEMRFEDRRIIDQAGLQDFIQAFVDAVDPGASDDVGNGALMLYGFGCPERAILFLNVSCARLAIIFSAIVDDGDEARREVLVFWAVGLFRGKTLPVTEVWRGPVQSDERDVFFADGGLLEGFGEVYVIDQSLRRGPGE